MAVVRRRHLITRKGREVTGLDDEVFDQLAVEDEGLGVAGEGALLAALERNRTGRMGDIVATIQAEQDEAIRADVHGVLVVGGGPGTGKTAVALHRAAYLLYTHRRRLANQGVLLDRAEPGVPALHRAGAAVARRAGRAALDHLRAEAAACGSSPPTRARVAELKGDARMARVIQRAVTDRERPLARDLIVLIDGLRVRAVALRHRPRHRRDAPPARTRTTRTGSTSRAGSTTCSSRATRTRRSARTASAASTRPPTTSRASSTATPRSTRRSRARSRAASRTPEGWEQELRVRFRGAARSERSARTDVAGAVGRRARQRPLRLPRARALGVGHRS